MIVDLLLRFWRHWVHWLEGREISLEPRCSRSQRRLASKYPRSGGTTMDDFSVGLFRPSFNLACATDFWCVLSTNTLAGELGKAKLSEKFIEILGGRLMVR